MCANDLKALINREDFSSVKRINEYFSRCMIKRGNKMSWQLEEHHGPNRFDHPREMLIVKIPCRFYRLNPISEAFLFADTDLC